LIAIAEKWHSGVKIKKTLSFTGTVKPMGFRLRSKMYRPEMLLEMFGLMEELMLGLILDLILGLRLLLI
jgi:hypothetical protein